MLAFYWTEISFYKEKQKKKKWNCRWQKLSKAIKENKLNVTIKRLVWEFNLYWKFTCLEKHNDKNKSNLPVRPYHSSYSFLNCWKTTKSMTLKFLGFQFIVINVLWKIKRNCMSGLFCIANVVEEGRKNKKHYF